MNIAICDDNQEEMKVIQQCLEKFKKRNKNYDIKHSTFISPTKLLNQIQENYRYDIYLLDIVMPKIDGIELGRKIREIQNDAIIIYLTSSSDYSLDAFSVFAYQYILKPFHEDDLFNVLDRAISAITTAYSQSISIKTKEGLVRIQLHLIAYIECNGHILYFHTIDKKIITSIHMRIAFKKTASPLLEDDRFIHPHKSYIINMDQINKIDSHKFEMRDGFIIPIAQRSYREIKNNYLSYLSNKSTF